MGRFFTVGSLREWPILSLWWVIDVLYTVPLHKQTLDWIARFGRAASLIRHANYGDCINDDNGLARRLQLKASVAIKGSWLSVEHLSDV